MHCHRRTVTDLRRRIGSAARADAVDPVLHVILIRTVPLRRFAIGSVYFLRPVFKRLFEVVFQRAVAAQNAVAQPIMLVAERGLPGNDDVLREIEGDSDRVGNFAPVFLGEDDDLVDSGSRQMPGGGQDLG